MRAVAGGLAATVVAVWAALVELLWLPLRIGGVPVPVSIPAALAANLLLVWITHRLTGSRVAAVLPALVWLVVVLPAGQRRPEGDLVLTGGWEGLAFLLFGVLGASVAVGRVLAMPRPVAPAGAPAPPDGAPAQGSGARR
ncbi:hypothetical protein [Trujillonella endophytica]|uniref:Uncharacterized protein n=1 Tax=Trujillonella endophytica TaxID=673521 RepID=A0A1H8SCW6_9ACTN|nr:hypothetical protein [Trujillella endophytica]SEO76521.1 hypothetical protein SAMN05660991_01610 [Trujillella endophytica]